MHENLHRNKNHQADLIARALLSGKPVNAVDAGIQHGVWRLSSVIHRLRNKGWPIESRRDRNNGLAHYSLPPTWKPHTHAEEHPC